jgi:hypothetical protein
MARRRQVGINPRPGDDAFGHETEQCLFVLDMPVQGAGLDSEGRSNPPHRERLQTAVVEDVERSTDDVVAVHAETVPCSTQVAIQPRGCTCTFIRRRHSAQ